MAKLLALIFISLLANQAIANDYLYKEEPAFYSYIAGEINRDKILFEQNSEVYTIPASCIKVVTAMLAYKVLGKDYTYVTKLYEAGDDVIIEFGGDVTLTTEKLIELLSPLKQKQIKGKIILDNSLFIAHHYSSNIIAGDRGKRHSKPISALIIDQNEIILQIVPAKHGELAKITSNSPHKIDSKIVSSADPTSISIIWEDNEILAITGNISTEEKVVTKIISPIKIDNFAIDKIQKITEKLAINAPITIKNNQSTLPKLKKLINSIKSPPLSQILPPALEASDNLTFDLLFLSILAQTHDQKIRDWGEGNNLIKALIKDKLHVDIEKSIIADGSGLSFYNRIKPKFLFEILKKNYTDKDFLNAMPTVGYINAAHDEEILPSYLKAKTGTLLGFRCLCGYDTRNANPKAFVIMASGFEPLSKKINKVVAKYAASMMQ